MKTLPWTWSSSAHFPAVVSLLCLWFVQISSAFNFGSNPHDHEPGVCSHCSAGYGVRSSCNHTHDTVCEPCEPGVFYSPPYLHMDKCQPCSLCGPLLFIDRKCTPSSDTSCDACDTLRKPHTWEYYRGCLASQRSPTSSKINDIHQSNDNLLTDQQNIDLKIMQEEIRLRDEVDKLRTVFNERTILLKELGSAVNHVVQSGLDKSAVMDHFTLATTSKTEEFDPAGPYEKNPRAVLIIVLLSTFVLLGLGTLVAITVLLCLHKKRIQKETYGGVKTSSDGTSLLKVDSESDFGEDEDAGI